MIAEAIDKTLEILELSHRGLARLIKVDVHTITENKEKSWDELTPMTRKKLGAICFLTTQKFELFKASIIFEILNLHVFKDIDGKRYSVLTAMSSDKFDSEGIVQVGLMAEQAYREKQQRKSPELSELSRVVSA
jgi:hypothetical protein